MAWWRPGALVRLAGLALVATAALLAADPGADDTAALQRRIDALPPGGTLVLEARSYRFQGLRIQRSLTVAGRGQARTLCRRGSTQPFFTIQGRQAEVTIRDLTLDGGGREAEGIDASGLAALNLDGLRVLRCGQPPPGRLANDGLAKPVDGVHAADVDRAEVRNCAFEANGRDGFIGIPVRHLTFVGNVCRGNGRMGCTSDMDPRGLAGGPLEAVYRDNQVSDCGTGGLHIETGEGMPVATALFERNRVERVGNRDWGYSWGLVLGLNCRGTLRGNEIVATGVDAALPNYRCAILVDRPGGEVVIEGNRIQDSGRHGISVANSSFAVTLAGNQVRGSRLTAISAYKIDRLRVERNELEASGQWGFWCRLCPSALVQGNRFRGSSASEPGKFAAAMAEASPNSSFLDNDFGGPPASMGLELGSNVLAPLTRFRGNSFEGRRSHPRLSSFKSSN